MKIALALTNQSLAESLQARMTQEHSHLTFFDVRKGYLWQKHWKEVDLFVLDDAYVQTHAPNFKQLDDSQRIVCIGSQIIAHENTALIDPHSLELTSQTLPASILEWISYVVRKERFERSGVVVFILMCITTLIFSLFMNGDHWFHRYGGWVMLAAAYVVYEYFLCKAKADENWKQRFMKHSLFIIVIYGVLIALKNMT